MSDSFYLTMKPSRLAAAVFSLTINLIVCYNSPLSKCEIVKNKGRISLIQAGGNTNKINKDNQMLMVDFLDVQLYSYHLKMWTPEVKKLTGIEIENDLIKSYDTVYNLITSNKE